MESTITYIVIAILVIIFVVVYNIRKQQTRSYLLSEQLYPNIDFSVNIVKHQSKIETISLKAIANKKITINSIKVELITRSREFNYYSLNNYITSTNFPIKLNISDEMSFNLPFDEFKRLLNEGDLPFRTFRFTIVSDNDKSYKSHELGFNKKWIIYRPDSGTYN